MWSALAGSLLAPTAPAVYLQCALARPLQGSEPNYLWAARLLGAAALVLAYSLLFGRQGVPKAMGLQTELAGRRAETLALIRSNATLRDKLEGLRHDERVIEEEAREMGMVRPDEVVLLLKSRETGDD